MERSNLRFNPRNSGRRLPQSKTLRNLRGAFLPAPASWTAAVFCRCCVGFSGRVQAMYDIKKAFQAIVQGLQEARNPIPKVVQRLQGARNPIPEVVQRLQGARNPISRVVQRLQEARNPFFDGLQPEQATQKRDFSRNNVGEFFFLTRIPPFPHRGEAAGIPLRAVELYPSRKHYGFTRCLSD